MRENESQQQSGRRSGQLQPSEERGGRVARRGSDFPSMFTLNPVEFLTMSPFALMRRFSDEFDRMSGVGVDASQIAMWTPTIDIRQQGNELIVQADLPGVRPEDVKVELTDEGLTVQGERKREEKEEREGYYRSERSYGRFYRLIPLPEEVKPENVRADFREGVLEVRVPLPERKETRREIPIQAQSSKTGGQGQEGAEKKG